MRILSLLILALILYMSARQSDSPHGRDFKITCSECHTADSWKFNKTGYSFDHNTTNLPLTGQHTKAECTQCHKSLVFSEAKTDCNSCHEDIHQATVGSDCSRCHTPASWLVKNVNELHRNSRFPLVGAHNQADCYDCHLSETRVRFDVPGINCIDCHRKEFLATTNPSHVEAGFSEDCSGCHPVLSREWAGAGFNHNFFPLVQGHAGPKCSECHASPRFNDASPECVSCHKSNYDASTNPNHLEANFPLDCKSCHSLAPGWTPANYDHSVFPLTLGHSTPGCADCHKGNYTSTPTDCYACHSADYNNTSNPSHTSLGFSTSCVACHTTNPGWSPAKYTEHDTKSFPINTGSHRGAWSSCTDCHANPSNYAVFSCTNCHEHNKTDMDKKHKGEGGYSYNSAECFRCHPSGRAD
ncbi:MAG: hypothetical protein H6538_08275 [Bacteroidales bacterium]|nr:hypothetical protein [Bacteroidales bacterium]MCB8998901.1 hypothetical protein [Bacteroidales bacterium]